MSITNLYYELTYPVVKHFFQRDIKMDGAAVSGINWNIMIQADRVWIETAGGISYYKHRYADVKQPVDLCEFLFIKLRSKRI